jgi:hypothetical protein
MILAKDVYTIKSIESITDLVISKLHSYRGIDIELLSTDHEQQLAKIIKDYSYLPDLLAEQLNYFIDSFKSPLPF